MRVLFSETDIAARLEAVAADIARDLGGGVLIVGVLRGGFIFSADIARALWRAGADAEIDFLGLSSYGAARESSGAVRVTKDLSADPVGRTVLLVDDVLDTGASLAFAIRLLHEHGADAVKTCVAVDKRIGRVAEAAVPRADYSLFEAAAPDFLVGYGMDDAGAKRGAPFIGIIE